MHVVICGGGVIGACAAWFLARKGAAVTVVERAGVAAAASGKAGGFLARDWCAGTPLDALARRSFELHAELAETLPASSHRAMTAYAGVVTDRPTRGVRLRFDLGWLGPDVAITDRLGTPETTAIVHPRIFTSGMMQAAERLGARGLRGEVAGLARTADGSRARGVVLDGQVLEADAVLVALGPWSLLAAAWLPLPPVFGLKSPSIVFDTGTAIPPEALFLEYAVGGLTASVEVFPRADGSTLVTAFSGQHPLPADPAEVVPDPGDTDRLEQIAGRVSPELSADRIIARQACFRPVAADGLPLIGPVPGCEGAYVATGHGVWGILNAPATGEALADLIVDGASRRVDLTSFAPSRMRPLAPAAIRVR